jgi:transcriptional regulator with XRE-family HTH domain
VKAKSLELLGERIRQARRARKVSQEQLAFDAGMSVTYLGGIERGERNPSVKKLCAIARVLGVSVASIVRGLPEIRE